MKFRWFVGIASFVWLLYLAIAHAQFGLPPMSAPAAVCGSYTGPGDITASSWQYWGGFRAFSAAKCGTKFANICDSSGLNCVDMFTSATTGKAVLTNVNGNACDNATHICHVHTLYDQSGGSSDLVNSTAASQPIVLINCLGTLPCMQATSAAGTVLTGTTLENNSAPVTHYMVGAEQSNTGFQTMIIGTGVSGNDSIGFGSSAGQITCWGGGIGFTAGSLTEGNFYAGQCVWQGAGSSSSKLYINGSTTTGTLGSTNTGGSQDISLFHTGGQGGNMEVAEAGLKLTNEDTGGTLASMNSNMRTFWGF